MSDLIKRQAAIDALRAMQTYKLCAGDDLLLIDQEGAQEELMLLSPAQPEKSTCDLISRQDFDKFLEDAEKEAAKNRKYVFASALNTIRGNLRNFPSAQPKMGHWIEIAQYSDGKHKIECSECGNHIFDRGHANSFNVKNKYKYCPNCGLKMEERSDKE